MPSLSCSTIQRCSRLVSSLSVSTRSQRVVSRRQTSWSRHQGTGRAPSPASCPARSWSTISWWLGLLVTTRNTEGSPRLQAASSAGNSASSHTAWAR